VARFFVGGDQFLANFFHRASSNFSLSH